MDAESRNLEQLFQALQSLAAMLMSLNGSKDIIFYPQTTIYPAQPNMGI
jgi:hypothetical protein